MDSFVSLLTPLQHEIAELLKDVPTGYFSGGTVLSGYLRHRGSLDVDLFVGEARDLEEAAATLLLHAPGAGWVVEELRRSPGFRRFRVSRASDSTLVDIVHEVVPQLVPLAEKPVRDGLRVDSIDDLVANKLCAVLGRSEVKDLVDLYFLAESGIDVLPHVAAAHRKDGGMEPATLAFVLQQMPTDPVGLDLLRQVTTEQLAAFRDRLVTGLVRLAWPGP
jgi:hypothetical protein